MANQGLSLGALAIGFLALIISLSGIIYPTVDDLDITNTESLVSWVKTNRWHFPFQTSSLKSLWYDLNPDRIYAVPFVFPRKMKVTKLGITIGMDNIDLEDTNLRLGWYNDTNIYPYTLIESSEFSLWWGGRTIEWTFSTPQEVLGVYWAVLLIQNYVEGYDSLGAMQLHYARGSQPLAGLTSIPSVTGGYVNAPVYYKDYLYGPLPNSFPSGPEQATEDYSPILQFVVYITELL